MSLVGLVFQKIDNDQQIAIVSIDRPDKANALNVTLMEELTKTFQDLQDRKSLRLVVLRGKGKHFSAGADLKWMQAAAKMNREENIRDSQHLVRLFKSYLALKIPKLAYAHGACFGGAVGLIACSDFVVAEQKAKFCLSEAKLGLLPAVIYPYLLRRLSPSRTKSLALSAEVFSAMQAEAWGFVDLIDQEENIVALVDSILSGGPIAHSRILTLHEQIISGIDDVDQISSEAISEARMSEEGQNGLAAFFAKSATPWKTQFTSEKYKAWFTDEN